MKKVDSVYQIMYYKPTRNGYRMSILVPTGGGLYLVKPWIPWVEDCSEQEIKDWYIEQIQNARIVRRKQK